MRKWAAVLSIALATSGAAIAQENDAEPYVQAFCSLRTADGGAARIHLLAPSLAAAIMEARAAGTLDAGARLQSGEEAAPECAPGAISAEDDAVVAEVIYSFPDGERDGWTDRLVLVQADGGAYVIDDIRYGAEGEETLRGLLAAD